MTKKNWYLYKHTCPNGKVYFGITNNLKRRWKAMGEEYHSCKKFYYAIRKYGWINITHEVLVDNLTKEEAGNLEREYITNHRSTNPKYGYNMTTGGFGCNSISSFIAVDLYDLEGNFIRTYPSCREAARAIGLKNSSSITNVCRGSYGHKSIKGYIFRYHGDPLDLTILDKSNSNCKPIYKINEFHEIVEKYKSITDASLENNLAHSSIQKACKTGYRIGGFYWCLVENYNNFNPKRVHNRKVSQYTLDGEYICTYDSIVDASKRTGVNKSNIGACAQGRYKQSGGYIWRYKDDVEIVA